MSRKTAVKANIVRKVKAVRKARAGKTTSKGLPPIDAERLLDLLASIRQLMLEPFRDLPRRLEAPPPRQQAPDLSLSFLSDDEQTVRAFEWGVMADALRSLIDELAVIGQNVMAEALYGYYWAEARIMDPHETLSDEELAKLVSYMEEVRAAWLRKYGTEIPPR